MGNPTLLLDKSHPGDRYALVEGDTRTPVEIKYINRDCQDENGKPCTRVIVYVVKTTSAHKNGESLDLYVPDDQVAANALLWNLSPFTDNEYDRYG